MGMLLELVADLRRWRNDRKTNNTPAIKLKRGGTIEKIQSTTAELKVGDLIEIRDNMLVPADCVVLSAANPKGSCFISTANLDGERNLKPKQAIRNTQGLFSDLDSCIEHCNKIRI